MSKLPYVWGTNQKNPFSKVNFFDFQSKTVDSMGMVGHWKLNIPIANWSNNNNIPKIEFTFYTSPSVARSNPVVRVRGKISIYIHIATMYKPPMYMSMCNVNKNESICFVDNKTNVATLYGMTGDHGKLYRFSERIDLLVFLLWNMLVV